MRRREFISLLLGATARPLTAGARDASKVPHIGVLFPGTPATFAARNKAFLQGLADLDYVEGKTIKIDWRWAEDRVERLPELATELVRLGVDVIVTNATPAAKAAKNVTKTIPIVMAGVGDPIATGLVNNLARPGGNITGISVVASDLSGKRLELLTEAIPGVRLVYIMLVPDNPNNDLELQQTQLSARKLRLQLKQIPIFDPDKWDDVFATLTNDSGQALLFLKNRLPNY